MFPVLTSEEFIVAAIRFLRHQKKPLRGGIGAHEGVSICSLVTSLTQGFMTIKALTQNVGTMIKKDTLVLTGSTQTSHPNKLHPIKNGWIESLHPKVNLPEKGELFLDFSGNTIYGNNGRRPNAEKVSFLVLEYHTIYVAEDILPQGVQRMRDSTSIFPLS